MSSGRPMNGLEMFKSNQPFDTEYEYSGEVTFVRTHMPRLGPREVFNNYVLTNPRTDVVLANYSPKIAVSKLIPSR